MMARMDKGEGKGKQGQGVQTQDEMRRMENGKRWSWCSGLTSCYTVGDHMGKEGE